MTWSFLSVKTGTSSSAATSYSITALSAAAGSLIVISGGMKGAAGAVQTGVSISDSGSNIWTVHNFAGPAARQWGWIAWCVLGANWVSATLTITAAGTGNMTTYAAAIAKATGGGTTEDAAVFATATGTSTGTSNAGNNASRQGALLVAATIFWPTTNATYTEDTADGWTNIANDVNSGSANVSMSMASQVNAGVSGITHAATLAPSSPWAEGMIAFDIPLVSLAGRGDLAMHGIGAGGFSAPLSARTAGMMRGLAGSSYAASLLGRTAAMAKGQGASTYAAALTGRSTTQAKGRAAASFAAGLTARAAATTKGAGAGAYSLSLLARATVQGRGRAGGSFGVALLARAAVVMRGAGGPSYFASLAGRLLAALKGLASTPPSVVPFEIDPRFYAIAEPLSFAETAETISFSAIAEVEAFSD